MVVARRWRISGARCRPTISTRIVSAAGIGVVPGTNPTPDDHFIAGPDGSVAATGGWDICLTRRRPSVSCRTVSTASIHLARETTVIPTPDDHFTASPDCSVLGARLRRIGCGRYSPTVTAGIVSAARIEVAAAGTTPDDHFTTCPDGAVIVAGSRRIDAARGNPTVRAGIVSGASIQITITGVGATPDYHLTASPDCSV